MTATLPLAPGAGRCFGDDRLPPFRRAPASGSVCPALGLSHTPRMSRSASRCFAPPTLRAPVVAASGTPISRPLRVRLGACAPSPDARSVRCAVHRVTRHRQRAALPPHCATATAAPTVACRSSAAHPARRFRAVARRSLRSTCHPTRHSAPPKCTTHVALRARNRGPTRRLSLARCASGSTLVRHCLTLAVHDVSPDLSLGTKEVHHCCCTSRPQPRHRPSLVDPPLHVRLGTCAPSPDARVSPTVARSVTSHRRPAGVASHFALATDALLRSFCRACPHFATHRRIVAASCMTQCRDVSPPPRIDHPGWGLDRLHGCHRSLSTAEPLRFHTPRT